MRAAFFAILVLISGVVPSLLLAQESDDAKPAPDRTPFSKNETSSRSLELQIESGFVILDGVYLPSPYSIEIYDDEVTINGKLVGHESTSQEGPGRQRYRAGGGPRPHPGGPGSSQMASPGWIRGFENNGLLISQDGQFTVSKSEQALRRLQLLVSENSLEDRCGAWPNASAQEIDVRALLADFHPTPEFNDRVAELETTASKKGETVRFTIPHLMRITTFFGMALTILAIGTLVSCRKPKGAWSQKSEDADYMSTARKCLLLIALLSVFDLVSTLLAISNGGFFELNPTASPLANSSLALGMFKLFFTGGALLLLWKMRQFVGVQVASWWLCLTLTVLAVRWVAVQSLFYT